MHLTLIRKMEYVAIQNAVLVEDTFTKMHENFASLRIVSYPY